MTKTMRQELEHYLSDSKNKPVIMDMVGRLLREEHEKYNNVIQSLHQRVKTLEKREQDQLNEGV